MTRLGREIAALIAAEGPIGIDRFMALALGHPVLGYYHTRDPLGAKGDFTTSPEISQMFGELIGMWATQKWHELGRPSPCLLAELGPGRGSLMEDALRAMSKVAPDFRAAVDIHFIETSPVLRNLQAQKVPQAIWHDTLATVPPQPMILIANEFFDALPIRQFQRAGGHWHERLVGLFGDALAFGLAPEPANLREPGHVPDGTVIERAEIGLVMMTEIARRMARHGGAALVIDYGSLTSGTGDTLQAMQGHHFVDPLVSVGEADLTTHVDFARLRDSAVAAGATPDFYSTQGDFLEAFGIEARAARLGQQTERQRLTDRSPTGMGNLFKAMSLVAIR